MRDSIRCNHIFKRIEELEKEYIDFWTDICSIESPTEYKEGVDKVGRYVIEKAEKRGWLIEVQKQEISGDCICITMNPDSEEQSVCFSSHMDTVHPVGSFGYPPVHFDEENIYGPGVTDCKGGIASAFLAMAALDDCDFTARPLKLILQSDEENGSRNSNKSTVEFMYKKAKDCIAFLNGEGGNDNKIVIRRKGIRKYGFEITGQAKHSSACNEGISAIREAAYKIIELEKMKDKKGITCNCGLINGGTAENTVPEKCTFTADVRFYTQEQMKEADETIMKIANTSYVEGTSCETTLKSYRCPMELTDRNIELLNKINKIQEENGLPALTGVESCGGADSADITSYGLPCLDSFGVGGKNVHELSEYSPIKSLIHSAKRMASVAYCIE